MKKTLQLMMVTVIAISVTFTSCKKSDTDPSDNSADMTTHSDDQARFDGELDAIDNDVNAAIMSSSDFQGKNLNVVDICNATAELDSTATDARLTITYNGLNCFGTRNVTGVVTVTMPLGQHWKDVNATVTVTATTLKITRVLDGKSITINGNHIVKNVSGGRLIDLPSMPASSSMVHSVTSDGVDVEFDNGQHRTWQVAKQRTFTYDNGYVLTTIGTHSDGTNTNIAEWGTNRFGNAFTTSITSPLIVRQDCSYRLVSGEVTHHRLIADVVVTFGLNSAGAPTSCPGLGVYYFKLVWTGANGIVRTIIWPY